VHPMQSLRLSVQKESGKRFQATDDLSVIEFTNLRMERGLEKVAAFGARVLGRWKKGSDVRKNENETRNRESWRALTGYGVHRV